MEIVVPIDVLSAYGLDFESVIIEKLGHGHINQTYLLTTTLGKKFVLQCLNHKVFTQPLHVAHNIKLIDNYLKAHSPDYVFPAPINSTNGDSMINHQGQFWRMSPFIENSMAYETVAEPFQAFQAAKQFAKLSRLLNNFDASTLAMTIPKFHDIVWRFKQFQEAIAGSTDKLIASAKTEIYKAENYHFIIDYYQSYQLRDDFPDRVMHHDTKISNVLLHQETHEGLCVIDLDTLMPGKFISDLGDMMRTYLCAFSEEETDLDKINIRIPYFEATIKGYLSEMANYLTQTEKELILFSGKYIIFMQALRFLTDYLNNNIYYPIQYAEHNLNRARNQFKLLHELFHHEKLLQDIIDDRL